MIYKHNINILFLTCLLSLSLINPCYSISDNLKNKTILKDGISYTIEAQEYLLGPNDVISIDLHESPEYKQENIKVQPDGKINIFPLGSFKVSGLSIDELRLILTKKYRFYLNNPQVSVKLNKNRSFIVYVNGNVINPGSFEIETDTNTNISSNSEILVKRKTPLLTNILVAAGGLTYDADIENIQIRSINNEVKNINLLDLLDNKKAFKDVYLMEGDTVHVPKLPTPFALNEEKYKKYVGATFSPKNVPVKVFGYVNSPGLIKLDASVSLNLNSAITAAGGYLTDSAYAPKKIYICRADSSGKLVSKIVNPLSNDVMLLPNDIVYVPEKPRPLIGKMFDYIARVINPFNTFANTYNNWGLMFDPHRYQVIGK